MAIADRYSELTLRIIFGILLAGLAVVITWVGGTIFLAFASLVSLLMYYEYVRICSKSLPMNIVVTALIFLLLIESRLYFGATVSLFYIALLAPIVVGVWEYIIRRSLWGALGLVYCGITFIALVQLRGQTQEGFFVVLLIFAYVWGADSFAYIAGRTFGGPKLAPRLSPGKTWSGFFGGLVGALALSWFLMQSLGYELNRIFFLVSTIIIIASQLGDLFESGLKRTFGIKDSGTLIPGHGGVLDRIDGFVFAVTTTWIITIWVALGNSSQIAPSLSNLFLQLIVN